MSEKDTSENPDAQATDAEQLERERYELLQRLEGWLETPMVVLAFVWLVLLVMEFTQGERPLFYFLGTAIWGVFILDFAVTMVLAPDKVAYLKRNWLTAISLLIPALRIFRVFRAFRLLRVARTVRGVRLVRVISSVNRGMKALGESLSRRGFEYVIALTVLVTLAGAAGIYTFENEAPGGPNSFGESLWWTAMIMTTMGSQYWPQTAALATFFVGRDADSTDAELAGARQVAVLRDEVIALRDEIRALSRQLPGV